MFGMIKFFIQIDEKILCVIRQLVESYDQQLKIEQRQIGINLRSIIKPVRETYCLLILPAKKIESKVLRVTNYLCFLANDIERK